MRSLILNLPALLLLYGCIYSYTGTYTTSCNSTRSQSMKIATDIFRDLGMAAPEMAVDYQGRLYINAVIPSKNKPGETIDPQISLYETKDGLAVWINDNGDGSGALSKKLRDVVERVLSRNNCSAWKLNEHTSSFDFK